jgi:hypothetical protein
MSCSATPYMLERHRGALSARMSAIWDSLGRWRPPPRSSTRHRTRTGSSGAQLDVSFESAGHQARCQAYAPNSGQPVAPKLRFRHASEIGPPDPWLSLTG